MVTLDSCFNQITSSDSRLDEDIVDLNASLDKQKPHGNQFINDEAVEASEEKNQDSESGKPSIADDCIVLAVYVKEKANAIPDFEHLRDMDHSFSDAEFVKKSKNTKRRRLQLNGDSECCFSFSIVHIYAKKDVLRHHAWILHFFALRTLQCFCSNLSCCFFKSL